MRLTMLDQVKSWVVDDYVSTLPRRLPMAAGGSREQQEARGIPILPFSSFFFGPLIEGFKKQYKSYPDYNHIFEAMLTYSQIITTGHAFSYPNRKITCLLPDTSFSWWDFQHYPRPPRSLQKTP